MDKVKTKFLNIALFLFLSTLKALSQEWSEPDYNKSLESDPTLVILISVSTMKAISLDPSHSTNFLQDMVFKI